MSSPLINRSPCSRGKDLDWHRANRELIIIRLEEYRRNRGTSKVLDLILLDRAVMSYRDLCDRSGLFWPGYYRWLKWLNRQAGNLGEKVVEAEGLCLYY